MYGGSTGGGWRYIERRPVGLYRARARGCSMQQHRLFWVPNTGPNTIGHMFTVDTPGSTSKWFQTMFYPRRPTGFVVASSQITP